jgi:enamine deaminase RidA (YjgF/YER057c/UK114 family)
MAITTYINPDALHVSPAFTQAVRVSAAADLVYVGGQNGVDASGAVVGSDLASQTRRALVNLQECLTAAGASIDDVIKWTILVRDGESVEDGYAAFNEVLGARPNPPTITVAYVPGLAVPDAVVEIEAVAAVAG